MFKFNLYSNEYPKGKELARCADESTARILYPHFRSLYNNERFMVTVKESRKKETWVCGSWHE